MATLATDRSDGDREAATDRAAIGRAALRLTLPSLALAGSAIALERVRSHLQAQRTFFPSRFPEGTWEPQAYGLPAEDRWFESEGGVRLHGWWIPRPGARVTVIFCHGNTGSIADQLFVYRQLQRLGVNVFAFDYRGYGRSGGSPDEAGLGADVCAAIDHAIHALAQPAETLVLFGHSLGGAVATMGAAARPVRGLIVQSSFTDFREIARHRYADSPMRFLARNGFRTIDTVRTLAVPKLFIHGTRDTSVPFEMGQRLYAAAAEPKQWLAVPQAEHNDVPRVGRRRYRETLRAFLDAH